MTPAELMSRLGEPAGRALLSSLPPYDEDAALGLLQRLRDDGVDPELASAALTQSRLRARAAERLGPVAADLLLTQDGLEQATRPAVAARHAQRLAGAGVDRVWDLGCGLGLDALALVRAGLPVIAVERDPEVAAAARSNLAGYPAAEVREGDALTHLAPAPGDALWLDPARRTPGVADARGRTRRVFRLDDLSPTWEQVRELAGRARATGCKLSPGMAWADVPPGCEAEWVSLDGSALECTVWWGTAVRTPDRSAAVGRTTEAGVVWTEVRPPEAEPEPLASAQDLGPYVAEPDRAVLAAGLTGALAATTDGRELDPGVGYVSATAPIDLPWARWYAVQDVLPLQAKAVRAWLRSRGADRVTLKKRGVPVDPEAFRAQLRLPRRGATEATLVLTRVAGRAVALAVSSVSPGPDAG